MKLELITESYGNELMCWIKSKNIVCEYNDDTYCLKASIEKNEDTIKYLCSLMEDLILISNDVVRKSDNIKQSLKSIVFSSHEEDIMGALSDFLYVNNSINIDGFLKFRLRKYARLVDIILYAAIKKLL